MCSVLAGVLSPLKSCEEIKAGAGVSAASGDRLLTALARMRTWEGDEVCLNSGR